MNVPLEKPSPRFVAIAERETERVRIPVPGARGLLAVGKGCAARALRTQLVVAFVVGRRVKPAQTLVSGAALEVARIHVHLK